MEKHLLVHKNENLMYGLCIIATIIMASYLLVSIVGAIIYIGLGLVTLFIHAISMSHIQVNGIRLKEQQFPELYQRAQYLIEKMELKKAPEVYIVESGGLLNAFATKVFGLFGKNMVVLYADFVNIALESEGSELDYVIAHELAHIKRNHIVKTILVFPAMWIPFIGVGFSRMAEYTSDRMAAYYTDKPESAINGLLILAAGKRLYKKINLKEYLEQYNEKKGIFVTLTELLSTHPPIPKRIEEIERFMYGTLTVPLIKRGKQTVVILFLLFFLFPIIFGGIIFVGYLAIEQSGLLDEIFYEAETEYTPLMKATINGDVERVNELINEGANPNEMNEFGETPLLLAVIYEEVEIIPILLNNGADPNIQDEYGWTPLMSAVLYENIEIGKILLEAGANPLLIDEDNMSAIDYAKEIEHEEYLQLLYPYL